jgi:thiol-disulfide isomerase/thioredoxin
MFKVFALALFAAFALSSKVEPLNMQQLQNATLNKNNDTLYVVNFWATWCMPCVKELPYFQKAGQKFAGQKVKVVFVSLNSIKELPQVEKFASDKQIQQDVKLLNAGNPNNWIDTIDSSWSGSIPATVMYRNGKKTYFREGEFTQAELDSIIHNKIQ